MCQSALKFGAKGIEAPPFPLGHAAASSRRVWRAIINSSFVRTTQAETLLSRELIRGPPAARSQSCIVCICTEAETRLQTGSTN